MALENEDAKEGPSIYRLDWLEQVKLGNAALPRRRLWRVDAAVWKLGFTSLLTDISAEMVNSVLPIYVVLHLRLSPLQYGAIDAVYNGVAVALLSLAGGLLADRTRGYKQVAAAGYALSAIGKPMLIAAAGAWGWLTAIMALDRTGKGIRTAPRDSLLSLHSARADLAGAFAVHRSLDAAGALAGPVLAFWLLSRLPGEYEAIWVTSSLFAFLGLAILWLFVENPAGAVSAATPRITWASALGLFRIRGFRQLAIAGGVLSASTVSDGFLYLLLQRGGAASAGMVPLFFTGTAAFYMVLSIPAGRLADRWGRRRVFLSGYAVLGLLYVLLLFFPSMGLPGRIGFLFLLGVYYSGTEGVLMAMASAVIPEGLRTTGLAALATVLGLARMAASLSFGWAWDRFGAAGTLSAFAAILAGAIAASVIVLRPAGEDHVTRS